MIKSIEQLIEKIEISPYVKEKLPQKYEKIKAKDEPWNEKLRQLLNFICPNLAKIEKKPNPAWIDESTGGGTDKDWKRYNEQFIKYTYENSQAQFPYTKENYDKLKNWIEKQK